MALQLVATSAVLGSFLSASASTERCFASPSDERPSGQAVSPAAPEAVTFR